MALKPILVKSKQNLFSTNRLECPHCEERFWMTSKYMDHMATHKHFLLSCNICNEGFYKQKDLDEHYVTHSEVINTYDCNECSKRFLQKYQLEQHKQSLCPAVNEPPHKKKKSVHFNNILESRSVEDFSDNEEDFSESDEDFSADYVPYKIFTQTRSGRVVKAKKIFENEVKVKRKSIRKSRESYAGEPVDFSDKKHFFQIKNVRIKCEVENTHENSATENTNENSVTENAYENPATENANENPANENSNNNSIAENSNNNSITENSNENSMDKNSNENSMDENSIDENSNKNSMDENSNGNSMDEISNENSAAENTNENSMVENTKENSLTLNSSKKPMITKRLVVVSEKLPDHIYLQYVKKGNICTYKGSQNVRQLSEVKKQAKNISQVHSQSSVKTDFDHGPISFSLWAKAQKEKALAKVKEKNTSNAIASKKSEVFNIRSNMKLEASTSHRVSSRLYPNSKSNKLPDVVADIAKISNSSPTAPSRCASIKEFVYVGPNPNPNMSKIKKVIEEMKTMSKDTVTYQANNLPQAVHNKNLTNVSHTNIIPSNNTPLKGQALNNINQTNTGKSKNSLKANLPVESVEGILDKKIVDGFTVIKVTPEYMQKIQKENFEAAKGLKFKTEAQTISDEVSMITTSSRNSPSVSKETIKVQEREQQNCIANKPSTSHASVSPKIPDNTAIKLQKESSDDKNSNTQLSIEDKKMNKLSELEALSIMSNNEKLFERYRAKLEEKERKKKEKYEFKKKLRYMAKLLEENVNSENCNNDKILSSKLPQVGEITENQSKDTTKQTVEVHHNKGKKSTESDQKSKKLRKNSDSHVINTDQFSDASIGEDDTFTISCPCNSEDCTASTSHISTVNKNNRIGILTKPLPQNINKNSKYRGS